jgi:hypothetical protein
MSTWPVYWSHDMRSVGGQVYFAILEDHVMHQLDFVRGTRLSGLTSLFVSLLLISPFGYGLPYLIGVITTDGFGLLLLLLLLGPSIATATMVANSFGPRRSAETHAAVGFCLAPVLGYFLMLLALVLLDWTCEDWSMGCSPHTFWLIAGFVWGSIVFTYLVVTRVRSVGSTPGSGAT